MRKAERDFEQFQRTHDARALGRVFDRCAPLLWHLAAHLSRDQHEAEDLVQHTFLRAIENAASWNVARPLLPWLLGILSMLARETRRKERRGPDPERLPRPTVAGPEQEATWREFEDALVTAIGKVPAAYRETLTLHLVHGLSASEIAESLGLRQGTVRMRVHRGLSQLKLHLPRGLSTAGIALAMNASLRATLRAGVLAQLPCGTAASVTTVGTLLTGNMLAFLGVLMMKKFLLIAVAFAVIALLVWSFGPYDADAVEAPTSKAPRIRSFHAAKADAEEIAVPQRKRIEARRTAVRAKGRVSIRVVNEATGKPVAGLSLSCTARHVWYGQTDANGTFIFEDDPGLARIEIRGQATTKLRIEAGKTIEHELRLPMLLNLEVRVVDPDQNPVPGARILGEPGGYANLRWDVIGLADKKGIWRHKSIYDWLFVGASIDGRVPAKSRGAKGNGAEKVVMRLQLGALASSVSGTVLDIGGRPCSGARVVIQLPKGDHRSKSAELVILKADQNGHYESRCVPVGPCEIFAMRELPWQEFNSVSRRPRHMGRHRVEIPETGVKGVNIQLLEGAVVHGQVHAAAKAEDIRYHVSLDPDDASLSHVLASELARSATVQNDGSFRIENLLPGRYRARSKVGDDTVTQKLELRDRQVYRWYPAHGELQQIAVRVLGPNGSSLSAWSVCISGKDESFHRANCDDEGRCRFDKVTRDSYELLVFAREDAFPVLARIVRASSAEHVIRIPAELMPTAKVKGRIVAKGLDLNELEAWVSRDLRGQTIQAMGQHRRKTVRIDPETGRFEYRGLPPGRYVVEVQKDRTPLGFAAPRHVVAKETVDFGDIVVGGPPILRIVAKDSRGKLVRDLLVQGRVPPRQHWDQLPGEQVENGFVSKEMPPLDFELLISSPDTIPVMRRVRLAPARETVIEITCTKGTPCVFELAPDSSNSNSVRLTVRDAQRHLVVSGTLNWRPGYRSFQRSLGHGKYQMEVTGKNGAVKRIALTVPKQEELFRVSLQ